MYVFIKLLRKLLIAIIKYKHLEIFESFSHLFFLIYSAYHGHMQLWWLAYYVFYDLATKLILSH